MSSQISVLLYGRDEQLSESRQLILQRAGYRVWVATDLAQIDALSDVDGIDLMILCHSLTIEECGRALAFGRCRWPFMRSLFLAAVGSWCEAGESELVFDSTQGPEKLLVALNQIFSEEQAMSPSLFVGL
jgi:hypothetical protein